MFRAGHLAFTRDLHGQRLECSLEPDCSQCSATDKHVFWLVRSIILFVVVPCCVILTYFSP